jgi:hypothetical protein
MTPVHAVCTITTATNNQQRDTLLGVLRKASLETVPQTVVTSVSSDGVSSQHDHNEHLAIPVKVSRDSEESVEFPFLRDTPSQHGSSAGNKGLGSPLSCIDDGSGDAVSGDAAVAGGNSAQGESRLAPPMHLSNGTASSLSPPAGRRSNGSLGNSSPRWSGSGNGTKLRSPFWSAISAGISKTKSKAKGIRRFSFFDRSTNRGSGSTGGSSVGSEAPEGCSERSHSSGRMELGSDSGTTDTIDTTGTTDTGTLGKAHGNGATVSSGARTAAYTGQRRRASYTGQRRRASYFGELDQRPHSPNPMAADDCRIETVDEMIALLESIRPALANKQEVPPSRSRSAGAAPARSDSKDDETQGDATMQSVAASRPPFSRTSTRMLNPSCTRTSKCATVLTSVRLCAISFSLLVCPRAQILFYPPPLHPMVLLVRTAVCCRVGVRSAHGNRAHRLTPLQKLDECITFAWSIDDHIADQETNLQLIDRLVDETIVNLENQGESHTTDLAE